MRRELVALLSGCTLLAACGKPAENAQTMADAPFDSAAAVLSGDSARSADGAGEPMVGSVVAPMRDAAGRDLGTLSLTQTAQGITLIGELSGLPPGEHAIHVHTTGRCDPPGFQTAGGHWNPEGRQHGAQNPQGQHLGDLPNIDVGADGTARVKLTTLGGTFTGSDALLDADGAAIVIHAKADDYHTDPAGNAGDRIACGVVGDRDHAGAAR